MVTLSKVDKYIDKSVHQINELEMVEINNVLRLIQERQKYLDQNALLVRNGQYRAYADIDLQRYNINIRSGDLNLGIFNVKDYGATGDGVTNDRPYIQDAIEAAIDNGGGQVYFPGPVANYLIDAALEIKTNGVGVVLAGPEWYKTVITGSFAGYLIEYDWTGSGNGNWRSGLRNIHLQRPSDTAGEHGVLFGNCVSPFVTHCLIENCDSGVRVGNTGTTLTQKMDISHCDFLSCNNNIYLGSFVECRLADIHGDQPGVTWSSAGNSVIYANPGASDYYDSLYVEDVDGFTARAYGIYLKLDTGTAGSNGHNHIGEFIRTTFESTTSAGIYVDAPVANIHGRLSILQHYGDKLDLNNIVNLRVALSEIHQVSTFTGCTLERYMGNNVDGDTSEIKNPVFTTDSSGNDLFIVTDGGQVKITGGAPGAGKILISDAVGLATWETPATATHARDHSIVSASDHSDYRGIPASLVWLNNFGVWGEKVDTTEKLLAHVGTDDDIYLSDNTMRTRIQGTRVLLNDVFITHLAPGEDIKDALDDLPAGGGIIKLGAGTYNSSEWTLTNTELILDKANVTVEGSGDATIINKDTADGGGDQCIWRIQANNITLRNFRVQTTTTGNDRPNGFLRIDSGYDYITAKDINIDDEDVSLGNGGGAFATIYGIGSDNNKILNNTIAVGAKYGIYFQNTDHSQIKGNDLYRPSAITAIYFIQLYNNGEHNIVSGNTLILSQGAQGISIRAASASDYPEHNVISNNTITVPGTFVDADSNSGQKVLNVDSTEHFASGLTVIINPNGAREETKVIDTVQDGVSLTMTVNLASTHTGAQTDTLFVPTQSSINIEGGKRNTISNNTCADIDPGGSTYAAIGLVAGNSSLAEENTVNGNHIDNCYKGITVEGDSINNNLVGNEITGCDIGIRFAKTSTGSINNIAKGNKITGSVTSDYQFADVESRENTIEDVSGFDIDGTLDEPHKVAKRYVSLGYVTLSGGSGARTITPPAGFFSDIKGALVTPGPFNGRSSSTLLHGYISTIKNTATRNVVVALATSDGTSPGGNWGFTVEIFGYGEV